MRSLKIQEKWSICEEIEENKSFYTFASDEGGYLSSQSRYDHFDTSPYMLTAVFRALFSTEKGFGKNWRKEQQNIQFFEPDKTLILRDF